MSKKYQNGFFIFGIAVLAIMVAQLNYAEVCTAVSHAGYWFAAVLALWALLYIFNTAAWYVIIQAGGRVKVPRAWLTDGWRALSHHVAIATYRYRKGLIISHTVCNDPHLQPLLVLVALHRALCCMGPTYRGYRQRSSSLNAILPDRLVVLYGGL